MTATVTARHWLDYLELRPRAQFGVDWSAERVVLVRHGKKELWWRRSGKCRTSRFHVSTVYAGLHLMDFGCRIGSLGTRLNKGGRLSRNLLDTHKKTIDQFFGCAITHLVKLDRTLIIDMTE